MKMWPLLLDYSKQDCQKMLRCYELEAYSNVVAAFRAQGDLSLERKQLLQNLRAVLKIPLERHRSEVRRVLNDEKLYTIAHNVTGPNVFFKWIIEGKRLIPLLPRLDPQTSFTNVADNCANVESTRNLSLPEPSKTRSLKLKTAYFQNPNISKNTSTTTPNNSFDVTININKEEDKLTSNIPNKKIKLSQELQNFKSNIQEKILHTESNNNNVSSLTFSTPTEISKKTQQNEVLIADEANTKNIVQTTPISPNSTNSSVLLATSNNPTVITSSLSLQNVIQLNKNSTSLKNVPKKFFIRCLPSTSSVPQLPYKSNNIELKPKIYSPTTKGDIKTVSATNIRILNRPNLSNQPMFICSSNSSTFPPQKLTTIKPELKLVSSKNNLSKVFLSSTTTKETNNQSED